MIWKWKAIIQEYRNVGGLVNFGVSIVEEREGERVYCWSVGKSAERVWAQGSWESYLALWPLSCRSIADAVLCFVDVLNYIIQRSYIYEVDLCEKIKEEERLRKK